MDDFVEISPGRFITRYKYANLLAIGLKHEEMAPYLDRVLVNHKRSRSQAGSWPGKVMNGLDETK